MTDELRLSLPTGTVRLPAGEARSVVMALRSFAPGDEMPSARAAARTLERLLDGDARELRLAGLELYEIVLAIDRLAADGVARSHEVVSFRHLLALHLASCARRHARDCADPARRGS